MQVDSMLSFNELLQDETDDDTKFDKSLRELRDLCSQLHQAADYCENTYLNSERKRSVVEHTREYLCRAVITVVDHLGCVSANLECCLAKANTVSETELRINCLKQRIGTCEIYGQKRGVTRFYWSATSPRFHPRYLSPPMPDPKLTTKGFTRELIGGNKQEFEAEEDVPLFLYTSYHKPTIADDTYHKKISSSPNVLLVRDVLPTQPKLQKPNFEFQDGRKLKRSILNWKALQSRDLMKSIIIRRGKRNPFNYIAN